MKRQSKLQKLVSVFNSTDTELKVKKIYIDLVFSEGITFELAMRGTVFSQKTFVFLLITKLTFVIAFFFFKGIYSTEKPEV